MGYATFDEKDKVYSSKEVLLKETGISISDPILPPKKLVKLTGTLSELKSIFCEAPLMDGAYITEEQKQQKKNKLRAGAASAMLAGNTTAALAALGRADGEDRSNYFPAQYITATLNNNIQLKGWIGFFKFNEGDQVEVVAEQHTDYYEVYAILKPSEQIICIIPPCTGGHKKTLRNTLVNYTIFPIIIVSIFCLFFTPKYFSHVLGLLAITYILGGILTIGFYNSMAKSYVELAERIFSALGWQNVEYINLKTMTTQHIKQLIKLGKYSLDWDPLKDTLMRPAKESSKRAIGLFYYQPEVVYKQNSKSKNSD